MIQNSEFNAFPAVLEGDSPGIHSDVVALEKMQNDKEYIEDYETAVSTVDDNELSEEVVAKALNEDAQLEGVRNRDLTISFRREEGRLSFVNSTAGEPVSKIEDESNTELGSENIKTGASIYIDKIIKGVLDDLEEPGVDHDFEKGEGVFVLSAEELDAMDLNSEERNLIKPSFWGRSVEQYYLRNNPTDYLIYTENKLIDFDGYDINRKARELLADDEVAIDDIEERRKDKYKDICGPIKGAKLYDLGDEKQAMYKSDARALLRDQVREKYPTITEHLDRYLDKEVITSDRKPYGIHRSREQDFFEAEGRVVSVRKTEHPTTHIDVPCYMDEAVYIVRSKQPRELECVLNSKLIEY